MSEFRDYETKAQLNDLALLDQLETLGVILARWVQRAPLHRRKVEREWSANADGCTGRDTAANGGDHDRGGADWYGDFAAVQHAEPHTQRDADCYRNDYANRNIDCDSDCYCDEDRPDPDGGTHAHAQADGDPCGHCDTKADIDAKASRDGCHCADTNRHAAGTEQL